MMKRFLINKPIALPRSINKFKEQKVTRADLKAQHVLGGRYPLIVGSGKTVAEKLIQLLDETGVDGFNLTRTVAQSHIKTLFVGSSQNYKSVAVIKLPMKQVVYATNSSLKVTDWPQTTQYSSIDVKAQALILKHSKNKPHKF